MSDNLKLLTASEILAAEDLPREFVPVPEWGGQVLVRGLTIEEQEAYHASAMKVTGGVGEKMMVRPTLEKLSARLVVMCAIGEDGKRLFKDSQIEELGKKSSTAVERLVKVIKRLSGMETVSGNSTSASDSPTD